MADKKYQVFISSTYKDLIDERRIVLDILLKADCIPAGMEAFVAKDDAQFEVIKRVIDLCDYYVLIIGKCYGTINPDSGISYTEMEYDYAKSIGVPVLVFAIDDSVALPDGKYDTDPAKIAGLEKFRTKALDNRLATIWKSQAELSGNLAVSIMIAKDEIKRPGWQRGTDFDEASLRREIMELQSYNKELTTELEETKATLLSFTDRSNDGLAFEDYDVTIRYHTYDKNHIKRESHKSVKLTLIFQIIATQMVANSLIESRTETTIKENLFSSTRVYFDDSQFVKKLLNQFSALQLLKSKWDNNQRKTYWSLTDKGRKIRDDMILMHK